MPTVEDIGEILALGGMAIDGTQIDWDEWNEDEEDYDDTPTLPDEPIVDILPPVTLDTDLYDKASVSYKQRGEGESICQNCEAWQGLEGDSRVSGRCSIVDGKIFKSGACDLFTKKK